MIEKDKSYDISITDLGKDGEGIGRIDNFTVFVKDTLPGDMVKTKIIKLKKIMDLEN